MFDTDPMVTDAVMPFVICRSLGGPHDDEAFFSGWRLAELAATLGRSDVGALADAIRPDEARQADLIAMARGYAMSVERSSDPDWLAVTFTRPDQSLI